jgi:uncharacterized protein YbbC (DUF1343 family)
VATGILGGASAVDIGIGTENPFGYAGGSGVNPQAMLALCQRFRDTSGVRFTPYSRNGFGGVKLSINPRASADLTALDLRLLDALNRLTQGRVMARMGGDKLNLFHKVYGSADLHQALTRSGSIERLISSWSSWTQNFRNQRQRYLMYS